MDVEEVCLDLIKAFRFKDSNVVEVNARIYQIFVKITGTGPFIGYYPYDDDILRKDLDTSKLANLVDYLNEIRKKYETKTENMAERTFSYWSETRTYVLGFLENCSGYIEDFARSNKKWSSPDVDEIEKTVDLLRRNYHNMGNTLVFTIHGILMNLGAKKLASLVLKEFSYKPIFIDEEEVYGPKFANRIAAVADFIKNEKNWDPKFEYEVEINDYAVSFLEACVYRMLKEK
jgi:hypothetical protein